MLNTEIEIERLAMAMMERHGAGAAKAAVARLNQIVGRPVRDSGFVEDATRIVVYVTVYIV